MAFSLEKDWDAPGLSLWVGLCLLGVLVFQCLRWERRSVRLGHWWTEVNRPWIALWAVGNLLDGTIGEYIPLHGLRLGMGFA